MEDLPVKYHAVLFNLMNIKPIISLIKRSDSPLLFSELLVNIPNINHRALFLRECGETFIRRMITNGLNEVNFHGVFPGISFTYETENYDTHAIQEGLKITKDLYKLVIDNGFKNFNDIHFYQRSHLNYLPVSRYSHEKFWPSCPQN
jgi:hypothetical protein